MSLIHEQMMAVMGDVQSIGKESKAKLGGGRTYQFRGVDATVDALGPAMRKQGVLCLPEVLEHRYTDYTTSGGSAQRDCVVLVKYHFIASDGSEVCATVAGEAADGGDKATPQAMSVAWRTCLLQSFTVPTGDVDPDHNNEKRGEPAPEPVDTWTEHGWASLDQRNQQWQRCVDLMTNLPPEKLDAVRAWGKAQGLSVDTFTVDQAAAWFEQINND